MILGLVSFFLFFFTNLREGKGEGEKGASISDDTTLPDYYYLSIEKKEEEED